jgi:Holliday junction resolvase
MSLKRWAVRRDTSEAAIIEALEARGFSVQQLSGKDIPDLLIGKMGVTRVVEAKTGKAKLEEGQANWWANWRGNGLIVLRTVEDVERLNRLWSVDVGMPEAA